MTTITTVTGRAQGEGFSVMLGAEPLVCAGPDRAPKLDLAAGEVAFAREPVRMEHLGRLAMGAFNLDDLRVDEALAAAVLARFAEHGGSGIVTLAGDAGASTPEMLARLSEVSGVRIVRGVVSEVGDIDALRSSLDAEGVHPAGIVGAVRVTGAEDNLALVRAHAEAAAAAGVALALDARADIDVLERTLSDIDSVGLSRARVLVIGCARLIADARTSVGVEDALLDRLISLGTVCCFDELGRIPTVQTRVSDHDIALAILRFAERGAGDRVALSSGIAQKHRHAAYGGNGLEFVPQQFVPYLRVLGADDELIGAVSGSTLVRVLGTSDERKA